MQEKSNDFETLILHAIYTFTRNQSSDIKITTHQKDLENSELV